MVAFCAGERVALRLGATKTGPNQFVEVLDPAVQVLVCSWLAFRIRREKKKLRRRLRRRPSLRNGNRLSDVSSASLFEFSSTASFRSVFKRTCSLLGLPDNYVPHSLRHGGATRDHLDGKALEDILQRGRWASTKSARHYIQAGRAILMTTRVPDHLARAGRLLAADLLSSFTLAQSH